MKPIITVVVPTKNRYKYLKHLISLVESFNDERIELLVNDNSDDNTEILEFLSGMSVVSTTYYHIKEKLSIGENTENGINKAKGEYICFIGDDDAVCRNIADCAEWMKKNDVDVVTSLPLHYSWNEILGDNQGYVHHEKIKWTYSIKDPLKEMKYVLRHGVPGFENMAKIYQSVLKKSLIEDIQCNADSLFPGPAPDMSGAVEMAFFIKKYAFLNIPVVIPGMSRMVAGGVMGKVLTLEEVPFISDTERNRWPSDYPPLWATELIWPVCALNGLKSAHHEEYIKEINKNKMLFRLVSIHRHTFFKSHFKIALEYCDSKILFLLSSIKYFIQDGYEARIKAKFYERFMGFGEISGLTSIVEAEEYLMKKIEGFTFDKLKLQ